MRKPFSIRRRRRKNASSFNPNHDYISEATQNFLKKGGLIKKVDDISSDYEDFVASREMRAPADDFLMGV